MIAGNDRQTSFDDTSKCTAPGNNSDKYCGNTGMSIAIGGSSNMTKGNVASGEDGGRATVR